MRRSLLQRIVFLCLFVSISIWFLLWNQSNKSNGLNLEMRQKLVHDLNYKINEMSKLVADNKSFLDKLQDISVRIQHEQHKPTSTTTRTTTTTTTKSTTKKTDTKLIIPIVVFAFNRPSVSQCLDLLVKYQPQGGSVNFPVVVSQDGNDITTSKVIQGYNDTHKISNYIRHPDPGESLIPPKHRGGLRGYYKLSMHYKWAITQVFSLFPTSDSILILEDDLEVAPDFFSYFSSMHNLLLRDPSILCISAWNDNGKTGQIDTGGEKMVYRSDFFPGLGWLLKRSTWDELEPKWPLAFWDDWIRHPDQMQGRACIRPEISRTKTFGRKGVSNGQFFDKHLKFIKLNDVNVDWSKEDLSYLEMQNYDRTFLTKVYSAPSVSLNELQSNAKPSEKEVRLEYTNSAVFKTFARALGIMEDLKSGVPRTAYHGIVSIMYSNRRVYIAPVQGWTGYDRSAS
ncbi:alpha-1,3-mannosyl-glycoprotein 2-beta-N-acetylglucosaminyltransferase [Ciona intestinalis]